MRIEIREVDRERGWVQVTGVDERWYARQIPTGVGGEKIWDYVPSVTWQCGYYPKGERFIKWFGKTGWDEAEEIKMAAGDKGSKVHQAAKLMFEGGTVSMGDSFMNPRTMQSEPLTNKEYFCLMTVDEWFRKEQPEIIATEFTVWNERYNYAGTVDLMCRLLSDEYKFPRIIDLKTSANIYPEMELQVSAYKHGDGIPKDARLGILQVGYERNKNQKYKFTGIRDQFSIFRATQGIWAKETAGQKPFQRDYPLSLSLADVLPSRVA